MNTATKNCRARGALVTVTCLILAGCLAGCSHLNANHAPVATIRSTIIAAIQYRSFFFRMSYLS